MLRISRPIFAATLSLLIASLTALSQTGDVESQLRAFEQKIEQGKYAEVEDGLMRFVIANQNSARGYRGLARVRFNQDRLAEARGLYQRAIVLDSNSVSAKLELAIVELRLGRKDDGLAHLNSIAGMKLSVEDRLKLAQTFVLFGEFRSALDAVSALPLPIQNEAGLPIRVVCHLGLAENEKVTPLIRIASRLAAKSPALVVRFAEPLAGTRFNKDAIAVLRLVVGSHPKNTDALLLLARSEINARDLNAAKRSLQRAAVLVPGSPEVAYVEALIAKEQGDPKLVLAQFENALKLAPDSVSVMQEIVIWAMRANQPPRAMEIARRLMALQPSEPEFIYLYGAATLQIGRLNEAEEYLARYVEMRPQDVRGCVALGITLVSQPAKLTAGQGRLEQCLAAHPSSFEAAFQLGLSYKDHGESEKAIPLFERSLKLAPNFVPGLRELGTLQLQAGQTSAARASLEKAVSIDPTDANTHFQLSRLYNLIGETDLAKVHFEKYKELRVTN